MEHCGSSDLVSTFTRLGCPSLSVEVTYDMCLSAVLNTCAYSKCVRLERKTSNFLSVYFNQVSLQPLLPATFSFHIMNRLKFQKSLSDFGDDASVILSSSFPG